MDRISLLKVALRQRAVFIPENHVIETKEISNFAADFCINLYKAGYVVSEKLLHVINSLPEKQLTEIYGIIKSALGIDKNWMQASAVGKSLFADLLQRFREDHRLKRMAMPEEPELYVAQRLRQPYRIQHCATLKAGGGRRRPRRPDRGQPQGPPRGLPAGVAR